MTYLLFVTSGGGRGGPATAQCYPLSAATVFSSEAGSSTFSTVAERPLVQRWTIPDSTLPGPTSTNLSAPAATIASIDSRQRTRPVIWVRRAALSVAASVLETAVKFDTSGTRPSAKGAAS